MCLLRVLKLTRTILACPPFKSFGSMRMPWNMRTSEAQHCRIMLMEISYPLRLVRTTTRVEPGLATNRIYVDRTRFTRVRT